MEVSLAQPTPAETLDARYEQHFLDLVRLARALGAGADSDDIAQEVLMYARAHVGEVRDPARLSGWLRTIAARRTARSRKSQSRFSKLPEDTLYAPSDPDRLIDITAALGKLPIRERQVLALTHGLGYTQEATAEILGIARGTVAATASHARSKLASALAEYRRGR
jgi:RNA polymerase sigma factor (sigma-70 family)